MDGERRLEVYARVNGQKEGQTWMTAKQRRRYWQKWFRGVVIEVAGVPGHGLRGKMPRV